MKKSVVIIILLFSIQYLFSQNLNTVIQDPDLNNKEVMVGECNRDGLKQNEFGVNFKEQYEKYIPSQKQIDKLKANINQVDITIVFGTWCSDSKLQVPRFFKILDQAGYNEKQLTVIGVNRKKIAVTTNIGDLNIVRVPTFIISQNGKELGRIIESPKRSLEKDLVKIVNKAKR
jgi:thiol-disulfide isomerase/thioredoxin